MQLQLLIRRGLCPFLWRALIVIINQGTLLDYWIIRLLDYWIIGLLDYWITDRCLLYKTNNKLIILIYG